LAQKIEIFFLFFLPTDHRENNFDNNTDIKNTSHNLPFPTTPPPSPSKMPRSTSSKSSKLSKDEKLVLQYFSKPPRQSSSRQQISAREEAKEAAYEPSPRPSELSQSRESPAQERQSRESQQKEQVDAMMDEMDFSIPTTELSEQKKRDYGYGVPQWSPYRMTKVTQTDAWQKNQWSTTNAEWGSFTKQKNSLDPALQSRMARAMVKEMRDNACMDHTWEIIGSRPGQEEGKPKFFMP